MASIGRAELVTAAVVVGILCLHGQPVTWISAFKQAEPDTSHISAESAQYQPQVPVGLTGTTSGCPPMLVGAAAAAVLSSAAWVLRRRQAVPVARAAATRYVAMEAGGRAGPCPQTGGPVCFCHAQKSKESLAAAQAAITSVRTFHGSSKVVMKAGASFRGTEVPIVSEGVSFPIVASVEVGEAGKSCTGEETTAGVSGTITMTQTDAESITIEYEVAGLAPGLHGFHIHEKADFSKGCASAGPHYNPFGKTHGGPDDEERHVGDLGNIEAGQDGVAKGVIKDDLIKLFGEYTVVGRSIMIHADPDDLGRGPLEGWPEVPPPPAPGQHTKTTGNAGARIACGVIIAA
eukprot:CAMPEP_0204590456 /NCGR_PEP_ID=MMETSP0661-20131031/49787_1 /ASSEMBLY_ACC=CAM_ASM_000606 /TAXON_ID=109239 /ORGANISM="Alexandrium margalefi, Strain AMGDE01CS-322" /LENGTH=346 /DNA_ID=CAMNT_0051600483 /DNA_START=107 /DNA_END=1147 /DNA_ORIENTATION=+